MTKINLEKNIYIYGRKYNLQDLRELQPIMSGKDNEFVIYYKIEEQDKLLLNTLEGFFISEIPLESQKIFFKRNEMEKFEKKYKGKFIPFEK